MDNKKLKEFIKDFAYLQEDNMYYNKKKLIQVLII